MINEHDSDILIQAEAAYKGAVTDPARFGREATRLVAEARNRGDTEALVVALHALARCHYARLEHAPSKTLLDQASRLARRNSLDARLGDVLVSRAAVNIELGLLAPAQHDLDRAAELVAPASQAALALQQAALHQNVGRYTEAADEYRSLLALSGVPPDVQAKVANNLAMIESERGRTDLALEAMDRADRAAENAGPALVAWVAQTRGWILMQAGRLVESIRQFDESGRLYEAAGLALGEHYLEYSDVLADLRLLPEARSMAQRAFEEFEQHGVLLMAAEAHLRTAQLALLVDDPVRAITVAAEVLRSVRAQRRPVWIAKAATLVAEAHSQSGDVSPEVLADARRAADSLERMGIVSSAVDAHLTAGRIALLLGRQPDAVRSLNRSALLARNAPVLTRLRGRVAAALAAQARQADREVLRECRGGLSDLARHRSALASMELRALASGHGTELGALGLATLVTRGSAPSVLSWMERTRAAALVAVEAPVVAGIEDELASLRSVQAEIAQTRRDTGEEPPELVHRQTSLESRIRRAAWTGDVAAAEADTVPALSDLRRLLDGRILVEYAVLNGELMAAVMDSRRTRLVHLGSADTASSEGEALLFSLRRLTRRRSPATTMAARTATSEGLARLSALLLQPLKLPVDAPLVVVPIGELQRIPWSPLHTAPVTVAPSASFWARTRLRQPSSNRVVLVAGPQLPGAVAEVDALREVHDGAIVLTPPDSTVDEVATALRAAELAHLACHGALRSDNPTFSSLLFSDGPLTVQELALRGIAPHRMVLASCDSGADVVYAGNEMLGFVSALMARGTAGIVGSMVLLPDLDAVPLMRSLHEQIVGGATLADALYAARERIDREQDGGFLTWCAFNAFGAA
jgi:tetratricopeptide (TPR) repeat protein